LAILPGRAKEARPLELAGVACQDPPALPCGDSNCPGALVVEQGTGVEPKTGRKFFLDYPCDLKPGEKVTFILSLHGGGSYGNWQRHYFPIMDYAKKYRLVIATANAPPRVWAATDDEYLQNIVNFIYDQVGKKNIGAFWLVGHSQGRQNPASDAWGHLPWPGTAEVFEYPHCKEGRIVADVVRIGKGAHRRTGASRQ